MPSRLTKLADELSLDDLKRLLKVKEKMTVLEARRAKLAAELASVDGELERLRLGVKRKGGRAATPRAARRPARRAGTVAAVVEELIRAAGRAMSFAEIHDAIVSGKLVATRSKNFANVLRRTLSTSDAFVRVARGVYGVPGVTGAPDAAEPARKKVGKKKAAKKKTAKKKTATKKTVKKAAKKKAATKKTAKKTTGRKAAAKQTARKKAGGPTLEDVVVELLRKEGGPLSFQALLKAIVDGKLFKSRAKDFSNVLRRTLSTSGRVKRRGRGIYGLA